MFHLQSISVEDFDAGCPVSEGTLGRIYRADSEALKLLLAGIPEVTRARLATYLCGRSHTHELGVRVAGTCDAAAMRRTAGPLGEAIHAQSRDGYARSTYGDDRQRPLKRISLAGSVMTTAHTV